MALKRALVWLPAALWMGVIFFMSAMPSEVSSEQSGFFTELLLRLLSFFPGADALTPDVLFLPVRKAAHMAEYAILALLYRYALAQNGVSRPGLKALALAALYAGTDELHQAFVPGRGPSPVDVLIDAAGAALALLIRRMVLRRR